MITHSTLCGICLVGQLQVIILHGREGDDAEAGHSLRRLSSSASEQQQHVHTLDYFLRVTTGEMKRLHFPKQPKQASANTACGICRPEVTYQAPSRSSSGWGSQGLICKCRLQLGDCSSLCRWRQ